MDKEVLITYGTKYGATAEIAEKIGTVLQASGASVDVINVKRVKEITTYRIIVLGSAVYLGSWRKQMTRFVQANVAELAQKQVWVFASGVTGDEDPVEAMQGRLYPPKLKPAMEMIKPVDITAFHGAVDQDKLNGFEKWVMKKVNAPLGDFRNWEMITTWAQQIAENL